MAHMKKACDCIRHVVSSLLLVFSLVVTIYAIVQQQTAFWKVVPGYVSLIIFIIVLFLLGIVEGLQIALVELKPVDPYLYEDTHPWAFRLEKHACRPGEENIARFLMGRQVLVVLLVFFSAKLTSIKIEEGQHFLFPVPRWFEAAFLESGLLACVVVVIFSQLLPQIVANKYPKEFLDICVMTPAYYACIFVEFTGFTHCCWLLSDFWCFVARYNRGYTAIPNGSTDELESIQRRESGSNGFSASYPGPQRDYGAIRNRQLNRSQSTVCYSTFQGEEHDTTWYRQINRSKSATYCKMQLNPAEENNCGNSTSYHTVELTASSNWGDNKLKKPMKEDLNINSLLSEENNLEHSYEIV